MHELTFQSHRGDAGPTTWGQREQWETVLANRPHDHRFNEPFLYSLPRSLPLTKVLTSLGALVERHEGLRTAFLPDGDGDGSLRQAVVREGSVRVPVVTPGWRWSFSTAGPDGSLAHCRISSSIARPCAFSSATSAHCSMEPTRDAFP